jgi:diguanylate cyclase (GGDEF)-like protein
MYSNETALRLMISLKKSMDELEALEYLFGTALKCYLAAIKSSEEHAVEVEPGLVADHRNRLRQIRNALSAEPKPEVLENTRIRLEGEVKDFSAKASDYLSTREKNIKQILAALAEAAESLTKRSDTHASQFRGLAKELETVSQLDSLSLIRLRLGDGVTRLKTCVDQMWQENQASVAKMEQRLEAFQQRLEEAEALASTDPLTGLANRREAEKLLSSRIQAGMPVCVMLFDLDGFKNINDRFGHYVGDQVLLSFASRLGEQFRTDDVVCRWGGDEFLVVLSTALKNPIGRADEVAGKMRGLYAIQSPSGPVNAHVAASVGVAQHTPGESGEDLFARADSLLYQNKRTLAVQL